MAAWFLSPSRHYYLFRDLTYWPAVLRDVMVPAFAHLCLVQDTSPIRHWGSYMFVSIAKKEVLKYVLDLSSAQLVPLSQKTLIGSSLWWIQRFLRLRSNSWSQLVLYSLLLLDWWPPNVCQDIFVYSIIQNTHMLHIAKHWKLHSSRSKCFTWSAAKSKEIPSS